MDIAGQGRTRVAPSCGRGNRRTRHLRAATLIAEMDGDARRMSEGAETAGASLGSLCRYFPDQTASVRTPAESRNTEGRKSIVEALAQADSTDALCDAVTCVVVAKLVDIHHVLFIDDALFFAEPVVGETHSAA